MQVFALRPGDPTPIGYFTTLWYFAGAFLCYRSAGFDRRSRGIWFALALMLLLLGINKQLDLQTGFTEIGRRLAHGEGWYDARRAVQFYFVTSLGIAGLLLSIVLLRTTRLKPASIRIAVIGAVALVVFVVIRAASFHHVDVFLKQGHAGLSWNAILEVAGITAIMLGALAAGSRR